MDVVWGCFFLDLASFTSGNYAPFPSKVPKWGFVSGGAALVSGGLGNSEEEPNALMSIDSVSVLSHPNTGLSSLHFLIFSYPLSC